jgi:hypothetical protein
VITDPEQIYQQLREQLALNTDACSPPELSTGDLDALLADAAVAAIWQPNTVYTAGAEVVADLFSLMAYRAVQGGTSGATAPLWPTWPDWAYGCGWSGNPAMAYGCCSMSWATITDGGVTWQAVGPIEQLYDLDSAISAGWVLKADRAATLVQQSSAGQSYQMQQLFTHCRQLAKDSHPYRAA